MSHLKTEGTVIDGWKFKIATDEEEVTESHEKEELIENAAADPIHSMTCKKCRWGKKQC